MVTQWTHVISPKGDWYPVIFFEKEKTYQLHGPLVRGGALDFVLSGDAESLQDAIKKVEEHLKKEKL